MIIRYKGSETISCFAADQIKEASFSLLPKDSRPIFLHIGKKLWITLSNDELNENIFTIARLLNSSIDIVKDKKERISIARIFLKAGTKSLSSTAFDQAFEYLDSGLNLLDEQDCWKTDYKLSQKLHNALAKSSYCIANYSKMNSVIDRILKHTDTPLELVSSYSLKIKYYNDVSKFDDGISTALIILNQLGECINIHQSESVTVAEIEKTKRMFEGFYHDSSPDIKTMEDKHLLSIMVILGNMLHSCYFAKPQLLLIASRKFLLNINYRCFFNISLHVIYIK